MARRRDVIGILDATGVEFTTGVQNITDVAALIPTTNMNNRKAITIFNNSTTTTIYIGNSGVTSATGFPITPKQGLPFDIGSGGRLYAICETGKTAEARFLELDNS